MEFIKQLIKAGTPRCRDHGPKQKWDSGYGDDDDDDDDDDDEDDDEDDEYQDNRISSVLPLP